MKLGIVLSTAEPETVFNVLRLGNYALCQGDTVRVFLLGKGVELDQIQDTRFNVRQQAESLLQAGGTILACGTCLKWIPTLTPGANAGSSGSVAERSPTIQL